MVAHHSQDHKHIILAEGTRQDGAGIEPNYRRNKRQTPKYANNGGKNSGVAFGGPYGVDVESEVS